VWALKRNNTFRRLRQREEYFSRSNWVSRGELGGGVFSAEVGLGRRDQLPYIKPRGAGSYCVAGPGRGRMGGGGMVIPQKRKKREIGEGARLGKWVRGIHKTVNKPRTKRESKHTLDY